MRVKATHEGKEYTWEIPMSFEEVTINMVYDFYNEEQEYLKAVEDANDLERIISVIAPLIEGATEALPYSLPDRDWETN